MFQSDFREVANFFVQMRETKEYKPSAQELKHTQAVLQLLNVMDRDHRFETALNEKIQVKEVKTMSEWLTKVIDESEIKGEDKGNIKTLWKMTEINRLTMDEAAALANLTVQEFKDKHAAIMAEAAVQYDAK